MFKIPLLIEHHPSTHISLDRQVHGNPLHIRRGNGVTFGHNVVIDADVSIGDNVFIGSNSVIRSGVTIGNDSVIGHLVLIEEGTKIGQNSTIQSNTHITSKANIGSNVFIGPGVTSCNDIAMVKYHPERGKFISNGPVLKDGCSVGAEAVIVTGKHQDQ